MPIHQTPPDYPELARAAGMEAVVVLRATIGKDGKPKDIKVLPNPTLGMPIGFENAAIEALREWRDEPARKDGEPVEVSITLVIDFKLS